MIELKFRAWDKEERRMYSCLDIFHTQEGIWYEDNEKGCLEIVKILDSYGNRKKLIEMQYIGLKDKNEKEIYEGDIVEWKTQEFSGKNYDVIRAIEYIGEVRYIAPHYEIFPGTNFYCEYEDYALFDWNELEIIGNIYENPEFLEVVKDYRIREFD